MAAAMLLASAVAASAADLSFWNGRWAPKDSPGWCKNRPGSATDQFPVTIRVTGKSPEVGYYESGCDVTKINTIVGTDAVILDLECSGEGESWNQRMVLMANDEASITTWTSYAEEAFGGSTELRVRCPG